MYEDDYMTELLFPHVEVKIEDNSHQTVASAPSAIRFFSPVVTEKGEDNVIRYISGTEFNKKYGNLNYKLQGQAGYNIERALASGGAAYVLRVLPEDATYAHVIMNIQTKTSKKKVKDVNGNLVDKDNVELRPVLMYMRNATSKENLQAGLSYNYGNTIDGYVNNPFLAIVPEGRGKYYNRYGFRLTPSESYDSTFDFRTYQFETLETDDKGVTSVIEGPFLVSFEPTAVNLAKESVFIKNVLENYSEYFKVEFNETVYERIVNTINAEAPKSVDIVFGSTRNLTDGKETYLDLVTGKEEDIHLSLHQYDTDGSPFKYGSEFVLNIVDYSSEIQATILNVDDTIRQLNYTEASNGIDTMKLALSRFRKGAYKLLAETLVKYDDDQNITGGSLKVALDNSLAKFEKLVEAEDAYNLSLSEADYLKLIAAIDVYMDSVKEVKSTVLEVIHVAKTVASTTNLLDAVVQLVIFEQGLGLYDVMKVNIASKMDVIVKLQEELEHARIMPTSSSKLDVVNSILFQSNEIIRFAVAMDKENQSQADASLTAARIQYNKTVEAYENAVDEYILPSELDELVLEAITSTDTLLDALKVTVDFLMVENSLFYCKETSELVERFVLEATQAIKDSVNIAENALSTSESKEDLVKTMKGNIESAKADLTTLSFERYTQDLRKYNNIGSLLGGSEGALDAETEAERSLVVKNLFIRAFKGLIDESILDEDIVEFEALLDGNFDIDVKNSMTQLVTQTREDIVGIMDLGLTPSPAHAIDARKKTMNVDSDRIFLYGQHFNIYDENSSSDITVTTPYYIAGMIPANEAQYGLHQPLAGRRGVVSGFKNLSWNPSKNWKNELYKNQINYVEVTKNRTAVATQLTSQRRNSALSNINNVLSVLKLRRKVLQVTNEHTMEIINEDYLARLNADLNTMVEEEMNSGAYKSIAVTAYANDYDLAKKIYRVRIQVVFKDIVETILNTITVQR